MRSGFLFVLALASWAPRILLAQQADLRSMAGDTLRVESFAPPLWGSARVLSPELQLTGPRGAEPFGSLDCFAARPDGGVAVLDRKGGSEPRLMLLASDGSLERVIGRSGAGPGEYGTPGGNCLAIQQDGVILMLDAGNSRLDRWREDGTPLAAIPLGFASGGPLPYLIAGREGTLFVRISLRPAREKCPNDPSGFGYLLLSPEGVALDTVRFSAGALSPCPRGLGDPNDFLLPTGWGAVIQAKRDTLGFLARFAGTRQVIQVRRPASPLRLTALERQQAKDLAEWTERATRGQVKAPPVKDDRPLVHAILGGQDGKVWLVLAGQPRPIDPRPFPRTDRQGLPTPPPMQRVEETLRLGAFTLDGIWLGEVVLPTDADASRVGVAPGNGVIWTAHTAVTGLPTLSRWRVPE